MSTSTFIQRVIHPEESPHDSAEIRPESVVHPATRLAGAEGHPYHPMLVTIPIGAWVSSLVFDVASRVSDDPATFGRGAIWLIWIGVAGAALAAVFGLLDFRTIPRETPARSIAVAHLGINAVAIATFVVDAIIRMNAWKAPYETPWWGIVFSTFALVCVAASGYLGSRLAYHFGVRVAGRAMQAEGFVHNDGPVKI